MVSEATVNELAALAELPLAEGRAALIAPAFSIWLEAASELNRKLASPEYLELVPITTFAHPPAPGVEE